MIRIRNISWLLACVIMSAAVSCRSYDVDEVLLVYDDVSLTVKGKLHFSYEPLTCQIGYDAGSGEFRAYNDNLSHWFVISCAGVPRMKGETVKADVEYTTSTTTVRFDGLEFKVKKTGDDGYVWLWNDSKSIGVVARYPI